MKSPPSFAFERKLWEKGYTVIGIDEVGRGSLAGPLMVGAVCFPLPASRTDIEELERLRINDSKILSVKQRDRCAEEIMHSALAYGTGAISVDYINKHGIVKATYAAARLAVKNLIAKLQHDWNYFALTDGFLMQRLPNVGMKRQKAIIRGDSLSVSIASASVIAKVERDNLMSELAESNPAYFWDRNKGYGTKDHLQAIQRYGITKHHRKLFVRNIMNES